MNFNAQLTVFITYKDFLNKKFLYRIFTIELMLYIEKFIIDFFTT